MRQMARRKKTELMLEMTTILQWHEVGVAGMAFYALSHAKWPTSEHYNLRDLESIAMRDISIDATVLMPAKIGPNQHWSLKCKVDTGASDIIMPMHVFTKILPKHISMDDKPLALNPSNTHLTAYNGSIIPHLGSLTLSLNGIQRSSLPFQINFTHVEI